MLTDGNTLSVQASARLTSLAPSRIIVAGGRAAVSDGVVAALRASARCGAGGRRDEDDKTEERIDAWLEDIKPAL